MTRHLQRKKTILPLIHAVKTAAAQAVGIVQHNPMTRNPKFFCENCNAEVRRDAMICPHCGRFFASVRCPACSFTGTHKEFKNGCPSCGYAINSDGESVQKTTAVQKKSVKTKKLRRKGRKKQRRSDADPLPLWIYGLVFSLAAVLAAVFFLY